MPQLLTGTARYIATLHGWTGDARAYHVQPPVTYADFDGYNYGSDEPLPYKTTPFVIVSATDVWMSGPETYIFPAKRHGDEIAVIEYHELEGSFRGDLDHEQALNNAGYEVI